jgi:MOSC domain-containing protein YiiM
VADARVISVNAGRGRELAWAPHVGRTAIDKRPLDGPAAVGRLGLAADEQVDTKHHGGPEKALYAYAREDLGWWAAQLNRALPPGSFGENITTAGLDISGALIGETWRLGAVVVQITAPRVPCVTFRGWMGERGWVKRFAAAGRPGAYLRVLAEGVVGPGDLVAVLERPAEQVTVAEALRAYYGDADLMRRLLAVPGLSPDWDEVAASVLARGDEPPEPPAIRSGAGAS